MSCLTPPDIRATGICIIYYNHKYAHSRIPNDRIQMHAEGHRRPLGLTRKQSLCIGRCNFLSYFPCMDSNYWSWARQRRQLIMRRYDNHWLIGQHIRGGFGRQGWRNRWRKQKQGTAHRWTHPNTHASFHVEDTHFCGWQCPLHLFSSSSPHFVDTSAKVLQ